MNQREKIRDMVAHRVWAVVGASNTPTKFGHKIYLDLKRAGYHVYPINPWEQAVDGDPCFPRITDLPEVPDVVDMVVPPAVGLQVVDDCIAKGVKRIWFQPGADSGPAIRRAEDAGMIVVHDACAMVEKRRWD